ncbi:class I SAM-dependent methyltransferase [Candidatus Woesearchaeota archaeon]|nr:class I SAM-dependent methyltransferase [Candidatus Woesearchaeota archaeon]
MDMYDEISKGYDELYKDEQLKKLTFASEQFIVSGRILDVGCGTGISSNFFSCDTGLDPSKGLLEIAKQKYPYINFVCGFAEKMPFKDSEFDFAISFTASQNFTNIKSAVSEFARVTKKGFLITILKNSAKKDELKNELKRFQVIETSDEKETYFYVTLI